MPGDQVIAVVETAAHVELQSPAPGGGVLCGGSLPPYAEDIDVMVGGVSVVAIVGRGDGRAVLRAERVVEDAPLGFVEVRSREDHVSHDAVEGVSGVHLRRAGVVRVRRAAESDVSAMRVQPAGAGVATHGRSVHDEVERPLDEVQREGRHVHLPGADRRGL